MSAPKPHPHILETISYVAGEDSIPGIANPAKLSSNESPLGASPKAVSAFKDSAAELARYPDGGATDLRAALANFYHLHSEQIICANGSEQLIDLLARAYSGPGDEIVFTEHAFIAYRIAAQANGATPIAVSEKELTADVDIILSKVTDRTRIVFLANPNNPTGTYLPEKTIHRLHENLPKHVLLVIDAAYSEYVEQTDYSPCHELVNHRNGNCVVLHTFSKIYGLAALRIGWAVCDPKIVDTLNRIKGVFNISRPAQAAAVAALYDTQHTHKARQHNTKWMAWLKKELQRPGLKTTPGLGNFLLVHFTDSVQSQAVDAHLRKHGIIVRPVAAYGLPQCLRVSIGLEHENRKLIDVLESFLSAK